MYAAVTQIPFHPRFGTDFFCMPEKSYCGLICGWA